MKVRIYGYWNAEVSSSKSKIKLTPEEMRMKFGGIHIADIDIDDVRYVITFDGKKLSAEKL